MLGPAEGAAVLLMQAAFFVGAWYFFERYLFRDFEVPRGLVQALFSFTFTLSCTKFLLIIFEITDFLDRRTRLQIWAIVLYTMLFNLTVILPLTISYLITAALSLGRSVKTRVIACLVLWACFFASFWHVGGMFPTIDPRYAAWFSIENILGRIGVFGVTTIATLSGYGAVSTPYNYLTYFRATVDLEGIAALESRLQHAMDKTVEKKKRRLRLESKLKANGESPTSGMLWRMVGTVTGSRSSEQRQLDQLNEEIVAAEALSQELYLEVTELHGLKNQALKSLTLKGRWLDFCGHILSVYCSYKVVMSSINILFNRVGKLDPVSRGFQIAVDWLGFDLDVKFWSQHVSFLLVGVIIVASVRSLLIRLAKAFHFFASSGSSKIIVLVLAQIMGMYFVSLIILMRMNLPPEYRIIITEVLGHLEFKFYHQWFDRIFLMSALSTIATIYLTHRTKDGMDILIR